MDSPIVEPYPLAAPQVPKGGRITGHGDGPRSPFEVAWAANRPPQHRPPPVKAGDRVLYRTNDFTDPAWAIIIRVIEDRSDPMQYRPDGMPVDDPWPWVHLRIDPASIPDSWDKRQRAIANLTVQTQEARCRGAAGYLHPMWHQYPQPQVGATPPSRR